MDLWVEKYRPQKLDDVIIDDDSRSKFQEYIDDKNLPHLLFIGGAGLGKCVDYDTELEVYVDDETYEKLKKYEIK